MTEVNPIVEWYTNDQKLCDLLVAIDQQNLTEHEAARKAFYKVSSLYNLPKFPEDVSKDDKLDDFGEMCQNVSVYEQLAIVKWMHPENTFRANVLLSMLYVYKKFYSQIEEAASEFYGTFDDIPEACYACFYGKDADVQVKFYTKNKLPKTPPAKFVQLLRLENE